MCNDLIATGVEEKIAANTVNRSYLTHQRDFAAGNCLRRGSFYRLVDKQQA